MDSIYCPDPKADGNDGESSKQQQKTTTKLDTDTPSAQIFAMNSGNDGTEIYYFILLLLYTNYSE